MDCANPYLEFAYPLFEITLWYSKHADNPRFSLREEVEKRFVAFEHACLAADLPVQSMMDVKYAIAAFIDEKVSMSDLSIKTEWMFNKLQQQLFGENVAGEGFYTKLDMLRKSPEPQVLEVYLLCLHLGFVGKYSVEGLHHLTSLTIELRAQIDSLKVKAPLTLSIDPLPRQGVFKKITKELPLWVVTSFTCASVLAFYLGFSVVMESRVSQSKTRLNTYFTTHAAPSSSISFTLK